jgi:uncharacterized lipoprotein YmbA
VKRAALISLLVLTTGCGFLSRKQSRFYTLERVAPAAAAGALSGLPVGVDVVEIPPGFDRREIVVRRADQRLDVRESDQWTASLEPMVLHTMAFNLADRLPEGMVVLPGQPIPVGGNRGIDLMFEEIAAGPENNVTVDVRWHLRGRGAGAPVVTRQERIVVPIASLESGEIAGGLSRALGELSDRIVTQLR